MQHLLPFFFLVEQSDRETFFCFYCEAVALYKCFHHIHLCVRNVASFCIAL